MNIAIAITLYLVLVGRILWLEGKCRYLNKVASRQHEMLLSIARKAVEVLEDK